MLLSLTCTHCYVQYAPYFDLLLIITLCLCYYCCIVVAVEQALAVLEIKTEALENALVQARTEVSYQTSILVHNTLYFAFVHSTLLIVHNRFACTRTVRLYAVSSGACTCFAACCGSIVTVCCVLLCVECSLYVVFG
jgi:hypothetical protein